MRLPSAPTRMFPMNRRTTTRRHHPRFLHLGFWLSAALSGTALAQVPPEPHPDQARMLADTNPQLVANKRLVYDFWREVIEGGHIDRADRYLTEGYIKHNPTVPTGRAGFKDVFAR